MPSHIAQCSSRVSGHLARRAANRLFEAKFERMVQVGAALGGGRIDVRVPLVQDIGEQIAERRRGRAADADREIEPLKPEGLHIGDGCGDTDGVVAAPAIRIAERLVRFRNLTEVRRRHPVARVDIGVIPSREAPVRALDVGERRLPLQPEDDVEVHGMSDRNSFLRLSFVHDLRVDHVALRHPRDADDDPPGRPHDAARGRRRRRPSRPPGAEAC